MPFPPDATPLKSWEDFERVISELTAKGRWIFRGVLKSWEPLTSLERAGRSWNLSPAELRKMERRLTRDFRRHPEGANALGDRAKDTLYVWALMQHYGAPTRLMDWTYSPYIAAFFAFEELLKKRGVVEKCTEQAAVWAINTDWLNNALQDKFPHDWEVLRGKKSDPAAFEDLVTRVPSVPFVSTANPKILNH